LNPSSSIQVQMVESDKWVPCHSQKAVCSRSSVHNSKGYPNERGFCRARLIKEPRTSCDGAVCALAVVYLPDRPDPPH
jgi:hypothetical protein